MTKDHTLTAIEPSGTLLREAPTLDPVEEPRTVGPHVTSIERLYKASDAAACLSAASKRVRTLPTHQANAEEGWMRRLLARAMSDPNYAVFVGKVNGEANMFIGGYIGMSIYNDTPRATLAHIHAVLPNEHPIYARRLIREGIEAFVEWCGRQGADKIEAGYDSGTPKARVVGKILEQVSFRPVGVLYHKELTQ